MKAAHVLASQLYCERVATHEFGNYAVQVGAALLCYTGGWEANLLSNQSYRLGKQVAYLPTPACLPPVPPLLLKLCSWCIHALLCHTHSVFPQLVLEGAHRVRMEASAELQQVSSC